MISLLIFGSRGAWPFLIGGVTCLVHLVSVRAVKKKEREKQKEKEEREKQITVTAGPFRRIISNDSYRRASAGEFITLQSDPLQELEM